MKRLIRSFGYAVTGLKQVYDGEPNMKIHGLVTVCVVVASFGLQISFIEWALVIGCVGAVLALECLNTSIECLADQVCPNQDPLIKQVKDSAAAGVLAMSIAAALIGILIFLPKAVSLFPQG